jgi:hypothetical protein
MVARKGDSSGGSSLITWEASEWPTFPGSGRQNSPIVGATTPRPIWDGLPVPRGDPGSTEALANPPGRRPGRSGKEGIRPLSG